MMTRARNRVKARPVRLPSFTPMRPKVLQCCIANRTEPATVPPIVHEVLRSPGQALNPATLAFFEPRFNHDFSRVPVCPASPMIIQAKLTIGQPDDKYEQEVEREADQMAEVVMRMEESQATGQREVSARRQIPRTSLPRNAKHQADALDVSPMVEEVQRSSGLPLSSDTRAFMEPRFGCDFSQVRVHTDAKAVKSADTINARAYVVGRNIVFGEGQYAPNSTEGRRLLAHELTHVLQHGENRNVVHLWDSDDHKEITMKAGNKVISDPMFVFQVAGHAWLIDVTEKRIFWTGPLFLLGITKGEGPEHGEDGNYSIKNEAVARAQNLRMQNAYRDQAVKHHQEFEKLMAEGEPVHKLGTVAKRVATALGNACHIAQDRGSHGEGVLGKGHDDPRTATGWDPDNKSDNEEGYRKAFENTVKLFEEWKQNRSAQS